MQATLKPSCRTPWPASVAAAFSLGSTSMGTWAQTPEPARVEITGQRVIGTASRLDEDLLRVSFSATVVNRAQMDAAGAKTLEDALRTVPGLAVGAVAAGRRGAGRHPISAARAAAHGLR